MYLSVERDKELISRMVDEYGKQLQDLGKMQSKIGNRFGMPAKIDDIQNRLSLLDGLNKLFNSEKTYLKSDIEKILKFIESVTFIHSGKEILLRDILKNEPVALSEKDEAGSQYPAFKKESWFSKGAGLQDFLMKIHKRVTGKTLYKKDLSDADVKSKFVEDFVEDMEVSEETEDTHQAYVDFDRSVRLEGVRCKDDYDEKERGVKALAEKSKHDPALMEKYLSVNGGQVMYKYIQEELMDKLEFKGGPFLIGGSVPAANWYEQDGEIFCSMRLDIKRVVDQDTGAPVQKDPVSGKMVEFNKQDCPTLISATSILKLEVDDENGTKVVKPKILSLVFEKYTKEIVRKPSEKQEFNESQEDVKTPRMSGPG